MKYIFYTPEKGTGPNEAQMHPGPRGATGAGPPRAPKRARAWHVHRPPSKSPWPYPRGFGIGSNSIGTSRLAQTYQARAHPAAPSEPAPLAPPDPGHTQARPTPILLKCD